MTEKSDKTIEIAILATPDVTASTVYGMCDLIASAGRDWSLLTKGVIGQPCFSVTIASMDGKELSVINNGWVKPHRSLDASYQPDVVCILELFVDLKLGMKGRYVQEIEWLKAYWARGGVIATACSGVLLLAESGLLEGLDATTHWATSGLLREHYPTVRVHPNRALLVTGEDQRLIMAGGGTSWMDLGLYLIARFAGAEEAVRTAKIHLIDWHDNGQLPYAYLCSARQSEDAAIARSQVWLAENYDRPSPVSSAAEFSGLTERSFKRRFKQATGMTPIDYVLTLRLEEAKQMLEATDLSVEEIAESVGYQDSSFFGRKFAQMVGMTPIQYRRKFKVLHNMLS